MDIHTGVLSLPPELCVLVARAVNLCSADLLALARVSRALRAAAEDDGVWRTLLARQLQPVLDVFFGGVAPCAGIATWKRRYFKVRASWKQLAQERTGRLLVKVGTQQLSGRQPHELQSLRSIWEEWGAPRPTTYGVYDLTDFCERHPGIDLREAAAMDDATEWFEMNAHSDAAIRTLDTFAVPGLRTLPYDGQPRGTDGAPARPPAWICGCFVTAAVTASFFQGSALCDALVSCDDAQSSSFASHVSSLREVNLAAIILVAAYSCSGLWAIVHSGVWAIAQLWRATGEYGVPRGDATPSGVLRGRTARCASAHPSAAALLGAAWRQQREWLSGAAWRAHRWVAARARSMERGVAAW